MLIVGLVFLGVIALGELTKAVGHRRKARRPGSRRLDVAGLVVSGRSRPDALRDLREWIALLEREGELAPDRAPRSTRTSR